MSWQASGSWVARWRLRAAAVSAALEKIPSASFIVSVGGLIDQANARGRALLQRNRAGVLRSLRQSVIDRQVTGHFELCPLLRFGRVIQFLAIQRQPSDLEADRIAVATLRWQLTPSESRVLAPLVRGQSNKGIASQIGCTERTVEAHVTHILQRVQVESRWALIAKFWSNL